MEGPQKIASKWSAVEPPPPRRIDSQPVKRAPAPDFAPKLVSKHPAPAPAPAPPAELDERVCMLHCEDPPYSAKLLLRGRVLAGPARKVLASFAAGLSKRHPEAGAVDPEALENGLKLNDQGHTPPSAPGLGLDGLSPPLTPDAPAAHLGHAFEPALAAPPLPAEYRIGDTIGEMAWKRSGWQRSQQNAHHLFLSATPKKLKPILDKRKALSDGAKPRGARSLAALFDDEAGPRTRRPRGGLAESASVPGAFDDDASLVTVGSLRSMPF